MNQYQFGKRGNPPYLNQFWWNEKEQQFYSRFVLLSGKTVITNDVYSGKILDRNYQKIKLKNPYSILSIKDYNNYLFFVNRNTNGYKEAIILCAKDDIIYEVNFDDIVMRTKQSIEKFLDFYEKISIGKLTPFEVFSLYEL